MTLRGSFAQETGLQAIVSKALGTGSPKATGRICAAVLALVGLFSPASMVTLGTAQEARPDSVPIKERNMGVPREAANRTPRRERDQALVDGWPYYRTERGQAAFNDAMATLKASQSQAPSAVAFRGCTGLQCPLVLPRIGADGWLPAGRLWVSPADYVLFVHSPRHQDGRSYRRRSQRSMNYFVFHEFHNSSYNTDLYDTISSHRGAVFVPFYMGKQAIDAQGRRFVVVVQVAPFDVVSVHATNLGSAGPGVEVARNADDEIEPLQNLAGIVLATMVKAAAPRLEVVNHRGDEGLPMREAYERRLQKLKTRHMRPSVVLPFVPAAPQRVAAATGKLADVLGGRGASASPRIANRTLVPPKPALVWQGRPGPRTD